MLCRNSNDIKKDRRWSQTGDKSQRAELPHKENDVQDANHQRRFSEYPQKRLGLHNRLEGRLPACAHSKRSQKVRTLLVGWKELPVPSPPSRTKLCAQDIHTVNLANCDAVSGKGNKIDCLPRRLPCAGRQELYRHTNMVLDILDQAGFQRNPKKCYLTPRQRFDYLGLQWDSRELRVFLPQDKIVGFNRLGVKLAEEPYPESGL